MIIDVALLGIVAVSGYGEGNTIGPTVPYDPLVSPPIAANASDVICLTVPSVSITKNTCGR